MGVWGGGVKLLTAQSLQVRTSRRKMGATCVRRALILAWEGAGGGSRCISTVQSSAGSETQGSKRHGRVGQGRQEKGRAGWGGLHQADVACSNAGPELAQKWPKSVDRPRETQCDTNLQNRMQGPQSREFANFGKKFPESGAPVAQGSRGLCRTRACRAVQGYCRDTGQSSSERQCNTGQGRAQCTVGQRMAAKGRAMQGSATQGGALEVRT
eukprot:CAMPEP_0174342940 /NCGR_PEP_ID=MMETSP0810-20121108/26560_1 /TAXON_ID=73025 ORGANISM="Eutreptiella gymnastica-like, Strain CCMP1594" /NCGR_SAMPLE_ID=MMETSP0810 /ASSEMBLY_ACC=CAM_ASM_000659 /LENGTH=211 /DNA_ID=CAMNT_0015465371 /DNA_START=665 /DNA_END=1300 /DNA_ORIENTATION=-